jgi:2,4-dienoyl-CoA reductase-like NADH-dependent reductase (Old Yellow Enzyme family)/NADPH-dependent 2,4-dienoyl-CoA reductase/sulfur reductase-like enzyme
MTNYSHVLSPTRIRGHFIKNRIVTGPSTIHSASNGELYPTEAAMLFFEKRAKAGAGIVTVAGVGTGPAADDGMHASWDLYQQNHTNALAELADRIHFYGAKASMELMGIFHDGYTVSDGAPLMNFEPGREIPIKEMERFKEWYANDAAILRDLGYDAVLLHFGHSIPVAQFLSPYTNKRKDQYGGSTENRCRYLIEILEAVRAKAGPNMIIEVRISGSEFINGGIDLAEGIRIGQLLQPHVDLLQVSAGMHNPKLMTVTHPCGFLPPTPNVFLAEEFKKSGQFYIPISTIGAIGNLQEADDIIASGKADFVTIARALIADIDMITKCREGRIDAVVPCIKCMHCHDSAVFGRHMRCAVNPSVGLEQHIERMIQPVKKQKKVAVIGGGPAGMKAALTAAERGHSVTLYEKSGVLGGKLQFSDYVSFKYPLRNYKDYLIHQIGKSPVEIRLNSNAAPQELTGYDAVISAVGAEPFIPNIPGIETAIPATNAYGKESELGAHVVVIGGGQVGCETALHLARMGKTVAILEMQETLAPDASATHRDELMVEFEKDADLIQIIVSGRCIEVGPKSVTYVKDSKTTTVETDSVILSVGMRPLSALADSFMGITEEYAQAGDCIRARSVEEATREGYYAGINL